MLLPFSPRLWRAASSWSVAQIIAPLVLLSLVTGLATGILRGVQLRSWVIALGDQFDQHFDPIVVENGEVRVEGERLFHWSDEQDTYLVDPEEVFAFSDLKTPTSTVVRRTEVVIHQGFRDQKFPVSELMKVLGRERLTLDGASIRSFGAAWGPWVLGGTTAIVTVFLVVRDLLACPVYALIAGGLLLLFRRASFSGSFGTAFFYGYGLSSLSILGSRVTGLLDLGLPCCFPLIAWPLLMVAAGLLALGDRPLR